MQRTFFENWVTKLRFAIRDRFDYLDGHVGESEYNHDDLASFPNRDGRRRLALIVRGVFIYEIATETQSAQRISEFLPLSSLYLCGNIQFYGRRKYTTTSAAES